MLLRWIYLSHFSMSHGLWCWIEKCLFPNQIGLLFCSGAVKSKKQSNHFYMLWLQTENGNEARIEQNQRQRNAEYFVEKLCWISYGFSYRGFRQRYLSLGCGTSDEQHWVPSTVVFQKIWKVRIRMKVEWWCVSWGACPSAAHARQVLASCCSPRADSHCGKSLPAVTVPPKHCTWKRSSQKLRRWQRYGDLQAAR